jgi:tetraacyldisaccharide 4'-kinase
MDDGHQNMTLAKDLSLIVVDGVYPFGNARVAPAGPLREPIAQGLARADAVVVLDGPSRWDGWDGWDGPVIAGHFEPVPGTEAGAGKKVLAFAGIGRPEKFFATLEALGYDIIDRRSFDDHHFFSVDEIMRIVEQAAALGARPITTAKDAVRLPAGARAMIEVLHVGVEFAHPQAIEDLLKPILSARRDI